MKSSKLKKVLAIIGCVMIVGCIFAVSVSATGESTAVTEPDLVDSATTIFDAVHAQINFTNILSVLGIAIGACASLYMLWWAVRKVVKLIKEGTKGKLSA